MKIGTKSLLYGAHTWWLHPWFVAWAWWKLYGFPWDPRLWVMFVVHDWGYWGKPNMDGPEGEEHILLGARIMSRFDNQGGDDPFKWDKLTKMHSRYWAKKSGCRPSKLCYADKLAMLITPWWVYIPCVWLTGEWEEYGMAHDHEVGGYGLGLRDWYAMTRDYMTEWMKNNKYGQEDTWTRAKPTTVR